MKAFFADIKETGLVPDRGKDAWGAQVAIPTPEQEQRLKELKTKVEEARNRLTAKMAELEPKREEVDAMPGPTLVEFGSPWCGHCRRAQPLIAEALSAHANVRHIKVADASGKRLGRSFKVKLWPTLVFLRDGKEVAKLVRPGSTEEIKEALSQIE